MDVVQAAYEISEAPMISAQAEAAALTYDLHRGGDGRIWLVAKQPNAGDNVYVSDPRKGSDGFAGAVIPFDLGGGNEVRLQGGWKTGPGGLLKATGVDVRDKCSTFAVVSLGVTGHWHSRVMVDVVYIDSGPVIGTYGRGELIAQALADERDGPVHFYMRSESGSISKIVSPQSGGAL